VDDVSVYIVAVNDTLEFKGSPKGIQFYDVNLNSSQLNRYYFKDSLISIEDFKQINKDRTKSLPIIYFSFGIPKNSLVDRSQICRPAH
jgi:hypothetical protein